VLKDLTSRETLAVGVEVRYERTLKQVEPEEELEEILINTTYPDRTVHVGSLLHEKLKELLTTFLKENKDFIAWTHEDMLGINPTVMVHKLNTKSTVKAVKKKRRSFAPERNQAVAEEVDKVLQMGFIKEVQYLDWLANVVLVKKASKKGRMCIDFIDLKRHARKIASLSLGSITFIDSTAGHDLLSFMDAFSGYNQLLMHELDQEKTSFITDYRLYCYKVMSFGLKNVGRTYQRLVNMMF
jgi:hypothetical protein